MMFRAASEQQAELLKDVFGNKQEQQAAKSGVSHEPASKSVDFAEIRRQIMAQEPPKLDEKLSV